MIKVKAEDVRKVFFSKNGKNGKAGLEDMPLSRPRFEEHRTSQDFIKIRQEVGKLVREEAKHVEIS